MDLGFKRNRRSLILGLGLLGVTAAALLLAGASRTTLIAADRELRRYWRGSYDILVRPAGARTPLEEKYGLVESNHLSGIWGGISFEQYETIRSLPGVEVAAPIAMIGHVNTWAPSEGIQLPRQAGVYVLDQRILVATGTGKDIEHIDPYMRRLPYLYVTHLYFDPERPPVDPQTYNAVLRETGITLGDRTWSDVSSGVFFPLLIAGIDPGQEAALVGLDAAVVEGRYPQGDESLEHPGTIVPVDPSLPPPPEPIDIPVLLNTATYVNLSYEAELKRVVLPEGVSSLDDIVERGGIEFLEGLPLEAVGSEEMRGPEIYLRMLKLLTSEHMRLGWSAPQSEPSGLNYREAQSGVDFPGPTFALQPGPDQDGDGLPEYRQSESFMEGAFSEQIMWNVLGTFDIGLLPGTEDLTRVPLETYYPPVATLLYDEQGEPLDPPRTLTPGLDPEGYLQAPPLVITTLEAARAVRGEEAISAIRVRLAGIEDLSPASQQKIEAVAIEIARTTGLTVDIVVGSSPARVLVHVPGIGYVEEQWIQKGVNLSYREGIQAASWLLIGAVLFAGGLFTLDLTWADVAAEGRWIALRKAVGWRSGAVFRRVMGRALRIAALAAGMGTAGAWLVSQAGGWELPDPRLWAGVPAALLALAGLASLPPAWSASRIPPAVGLRTQGYRRGRYIWPRRGSPGPATATGLAGLAWNGLARRPGRALLTALGAAVSAALLTLLLAVALDQRGFLSGTLLGEFVLQRIEPYHYAIAGIGFALAALSILNGQLMSVLERRREVGVMKAIGWRTRSVAAQFVLEGALLAAVGGAAGAAVGLAIFWALYRSLPASPAVGLLPPLAAGLVGALAALYPARLAARVPPAQAVRYE